MSEYNFVPAVKGMAGARILLIGPYSSGKTYTALTIAKALTNTPAAVIDTDRSRSLAYAAQFDFTHQPLANAYDPREVPKMVAAAEASGADCLVIDTLTPFWSGRGGMLELVDQFTTAQNSKDKFGTGWNLARVHERDMFDAIHNFAGHLICTCRTKIEWVLESDGNGKMRPRAVGTTPDQRQGIEYEFDLVLMLDQDNIATVIKSVVPGLRRGTQIKEPGADVARLMMDWLRTGSQGEQFSALAVRDWAASENRTAAELRNRRAELDAGGYLNCMILAPNGVSMSLADMLDLRITTMTRAEERMRAMAAGNGTRERPAP